MLSHLYLVYMDRRWNLKVFESDWLSKIIKGVRKCNDNSEKKKALPLTLNILQKVTLLTILLFLTPL
jgi:hypothetical protein